MAMLGLGINAIATSLAMNVGAAATRAGRRPRGDARACTHLGPLPGAPGDLPGRDAQLAGYLGGGGWRVGHEQVEQALPVDRLKPSQPGHLGELSGGAFPKLEVLKDRRDECGVVIDQALPRLPVPVRCALHQPRNI